MTVKYKIDECEGYGRPPRKTYHVEGIPSLVGYILHAPLLNKCGHVEVSVEGVKVQSSKESVNNG